MVAATRSSTRSTTNTTTSNTTNSNNTTNTTNNTSSSSSSKTSSTSSSAAAAKPQASKQKQGSKKSRTSDRATTTTATVRSKNNKHAAPSHSSNAKQQSRTDADKEPFAPRADIPSDLLDTSHPYPSLLSPRLRFSYVIARGEQGVLTFEPYKGHLLPYWRFRSPAIAQASAETLFARFNDYGAAGDFVGMDMARKFIQMGMTRAKRYANYAGGSKYHRYKGVSGTKGRVSSVPKQKSAGHEGQEEKLRASEIFRGFWHKCRQDETYARLQEQWAQDKQTWLELDEHEQRKREDLAQKTRSKEEHG